MGRLLLVRHAQSVWNAAGRWQGWSDASLSELGLLQAEQAGCSLAAADVVPDVVACSDLARSRRTAELVAAAVGHTKPLVIDPDLREHNLGDWQGLTTEEIHARWPDQLQAWQRGDLESIPGGEPGASFSNRALNALRRLATGNLDGLVLVVAHGGVVMALESSLGGPRLGRHSNLSGWWLETQGTPLGVVFVPLAPVDLLAVDAEAVSSLA
jgi:broad specificity phosphatase PhoE